MKKLLVLLCLLGVSAIYAQAPQFLNYQGIARDASGSVVTSNIGIKFEILQGSTPVYTEEQSVTPSAAGVFTAAIGNGINQVGVFSSINWATGPYSIRVSIDPTGGTSYSTVGTSQLLSVPYALYAEKAGNTQTVNITGPNVTGTYPNFTINPPGALTPSTGISITGGTITNTAPDLTMTLTATGIASVSGTYPNYNVDVPPPALNFNNVNNILTLTQGTAVTTASISSGSATTSPTGIMINSPHTASTVSPNNYSITIQPTNITGTGVTGTYPSYTINSVAQTSITSGSANVIVNGSAPSYTISAGTPTLQINSPNSITPLGLNNYSINVPPSAPATTVIAGTNVTVGGTGPTYTVNAIPTLSLGGNVLSISGGNSVTLPVPPAQTSVTAGSNVVVNGSAPSYTVNATVPTLSLTGTTLTSGPSTNSVNLSSLSVWSNSVGVLYPTTITNSVGIGTSTATALLDVIGNSTVTVGKFANSTNTGGAVITADHVGGSSASTYYGVKASASAIGGTTYGLYGTAGGSGTAYGVYGSMNGAGGYGVYGIAPAGGNGVGVAGISNAGSTTGAFGVFGSSQNSFGGVFQNSAGTVSVTLGGQTHSGIFLGGNVGINVANPTNRLHVQESTNPSPAVFGTQTSAASSGNAHGIFGITNNPNITAAGVAGQNTGLGPAVYGIKMSSNGSAGRFENTLTTNTADALFATTNGSGAAIHAVNGPTVAGSSNAAVWLENGHLKSTASVSPGTTTISVSGGGVQSGTITLGAGSTDIKGVLQAVITTTGQINSGNNIVARVNFNKSYSVAPVVVLTPATDPGLLHPFISGVTPGSFTVTIKNTTPNSMAAGTTFTFNLNYMVIE